MFPRDAIARARFYLQKIPGGIGAYRYSQLSLQHKCNCTLDIM
jgi:hypothetical protein